MREPNRPKLYALLADPEEQHDVSDRYPEMVHELQSHVTSQLQRASATSSSSPIVEPGLDQAVVARLRNLGYLG